MDGIRFVAVLRGRWRFVALLFGGVVLLVLAAAGWRPALYTATASVVLDARADPVSAASSSGPGASSQLATQVDILRNERVALRVVQGLPPENLARWRAEFEAADPGERSFEAWLADELRERLQVRPAREGNVLHVAFTDEQPRQAAELANAFVRAYMDTALELRVEPASRFVDFFEQRTRAARSALEQAQSRLTAYQKQHRIVASDERLDVETARLAELSTQLAALQAASADSSSRQAQASGQQADRLQEVLGNPAIQQVKAEIGQADARLQQLFTRLGDNHPQVTELRAQLSELRSRLDEETRRVAGGVGVTNRINRQREAEIRAALEAQRAQLLRERSQREEGLVLQREAEQAQRAHDSLMQRLWQSRLESQSTQGQASVLALAQPPAEPSSPRWWLSAALAALFGALFAMGSALALELRAPRLRCNEDVGTALQLPLLVAMPRVPMTGART